jgi:tripartite-type tricarboxylate transporter receptor subunit TctC
MSTARLSIMSVLLAITTLFAEVAGAQDAYPSKLLRFVVPYPAGGTSDVLARVVAQKLTEVLHRQVIIENRPGAAGNIGHEGVAKLPGDGYTLLLTTKGQMVQNQFLYKRLGFDPLNDFTHISFIATAGHALVVHPAVPARSVKELIALARRQPGKLSYGCAGPGSTSHIVTEVFKSNEKVDIVQVPYKGVTQAVGEVVGGQIEMVFSDMVPAVPQIRSGRLRALAVTTSERSAALPNVPTMAESGVKGDLPTQWWGVIAPKGVPAEIVKRLNGEIQRIVMLPEINERYNDLGIMPLVSAPQRMVEEIRSDTRKTSKLFAELGLKPE